MKKISILIILLIFCCSRNFAQSIGSQDSLDSKKESSVVGKVINWYTDNLNYFSITILMTIESSFIPLPSEIVMPPAAYAACDENNESLYVTEYKWINILFVIIFGSIGALMGALLNYFLSFTLGRFIIYKFADSKFGHLFFLNSDKVKKAENYFIKHGNMSTFIGRLVPGIRHLISIPAGLSKMKLGSFILYTVLGATIWNICLALLGYIAHGQQDIIQKYSDELSYVLLAIGILFILYLVYQGFKKKKSKTVE